MGLAGECHCGKKFRGIGADGFRRDGGVVRAADVLEPRHQRPEVVADEAAPLARLDGVLAQVADLAVTCDDGFFRHSPHLPAGRPR